MVQAAQIAVVVAPIDDIGVQRVRYDIAGFETGGGFPVALGNARTTRSASDAHAGIVLLRTEDTIRKSIVGRHPVDLRRGLIVQRAPVLAAVKADLGATVIGKDQPVAILRVDPEIMVIAMRCPHLRKGLSSIQAPHKFHVGTIDRVLIRRIDVYPVKIPCSLFDIVLAIDKAPVCTAVRTHEQPTVCILDHRIHLVGIGGRNRDVHDAPDTFGQAPATGKVHPGLTPIRTLIQPAAFAAALHAIGSALDAPHARVEDHGITRLHHQFGARSLIIDIKHPPPALATVGGLINASFRIGSEEMAHGRDPYDIGVPGMYDDPRDVPGVFQSKIAPAAAAVVAAPYPPEVFGDIVPQGAFPFAGIYNGFIGWGDGSRPYPAAKPAVGYILPVAAAVGSFP